ncbi:MAG: DUF1232 domain-containing protein, partial [Planctomycetes bacterium]|nr:DUF1232 domain-containing protein [Planctomycetota bacterium]
MNKFESLDDLRASDLYPRSREEVVTAKERVRDEVQRKLAEGRDIPGQVAQQARTLVGFLLEDRYQHPFDAEALAVAALRYFVGESDAIPDGAEGTGYLDDSIIFSAVIEQVLAAQQPPTKTPDGSVAPAPAPAPAVAAPVATPPPAPPVPAPAPALPPAPKAAPVAKAAPRKAVAPAPKPSPRARPAKPAKAAKPAKRKPQAAKAPAKKSSKPPAKKSAKPSAKPSVAAHGKSRSHAGGARAPRKAAPA